MAHAEKCPVCYGTGNTAKEMPPYVGTRQNCPACGGKGWVEVLDAAREVSDNPQYYAPVHYDRYQKTP